MIISPDTINGLLEFSGAGFVLNSCRKVLAHRSATGTSLVSAIYFFAWGCWNLYYYPSLGQYFSLAGGIAIAAANICWISLMYHFRITKELA